MVGRGGKGRFEQVKFFLLYQKIEAQTWGEAGAENTNLSFIYAAPGPRLDTEEEQGLLDRFAFPSTKQAQQLSRGRGCVNPLILCWQENTEALGRAPGCEWRAQRFALSRAEDTAALSMWECGNSYGSCR